eukprot:TRINITY_DN13804_c0_g1_i2.p1 TRINITY_DN13804_c0_g1~~TRINITY_DN13804_c0_g1_i2.p1  ORF type:complete len:165 (-),score=26.96 TRINITY_DN13804_c0_g1_i2:827-1321(-)
MLRSLVGSEMCIRDRYQRRVRGSGAMGSCGSKGSPPCVARRMCAQELYNLQCDLGAFPLLICTSSKEQDRIDQAAMARSEQHAMQLGDERPYTHLVLYGPHAESWAPTLVSVFPAPHVCVLRDLAGYQALYPFNMCKHEHHVTGRLFRESPSLNPAQIGLCQHL